MTALRIDVDTAGQVPVLRLVGELDIATVHLIPPRADAALNGAAALIVDLSGVTFMGADGIGAMIQLKQLCQSRGAELQLTGLTPTVIKLFTIAGLNQHFGLS